MMRGVTVVELTREQVLTHRVAVHGLVHRAATTPTDLAVLDLGVQGTPPSSVLAALSVRLAEPLGPEADVTAGGALTLVWSHRGAPHLDRTADLTALAAACWPRDDADAAVRLGWQRSPMAEAGWASRAAYRTLAGAVREVLVEPMTKGELSTVLTARLPAALSPFCPGCGIHHVGEPLLRNAALAGGARARPGSKPVVLEPIPGWPGPPADEDAGTARLQRACRHLHPPASDADVAGYLGTLPSVLRPDRQADLVAVRVDGRAATASPEGLDAIRRAEPGELVRLLPPSDPLLQGRDHEILVPDPAHRRRLWTALGGPGAVLAGVDVAGLWRARRRGRTVALEVEELRPLRPSERAELEVEAARLAAARGAGDVTVEIRRA